MLKNIKLAGKTIVTIYGKVTFDEKGVTNDLTRDQAEKFSQIEGYELMEETFQDEDEREEETVEEEVEEPEEELEEELEEEPVEEKQEYTKSQLNNKTVAEIEKIAKKEFGIELSDGVKKEKIEEVLEAQKRKG